MLCSFSLNKGTIEKYQSIIPSSKSKKIIRNFLLNEYVLPNELDQLPKKVHNVEICTIRLNEAELNKMNYLLLLAKNRGVELKKSALMRNVYEQLINQYEGQKIEQSQQHRQTFKVPSGTKKRLSALVKERTRTYELATFIMEEYRPSNKFTSMRGQEQEGFDFKTDIEVFEKMDRISEEYGFKKGGRAKIFRDALLQFEQKLQESTPFEKELEQRLLTIIEEYKAVTDKAIIQAKINKYLD